jgi:S-DNA-T family DNA segregation ATPase FtsK/SpoIIIE
MFRRSAAWLLFFGAVYLALGFATYDASASGRSLANLAGSPGRFFAGTLVEAFGIGAFALCFYMAFLGYRFHAARRLSEPFLRLLGISVCMLTLGAFWQAILPGRAYPGGQIPLGGILGDEVAFRLGALLGSVLTVATMGVGGLAGLLLATDDLLPNLMRRRVPLNAAAHSRRAPRNAVADDASPEPAADIDPEFWDVGVPEEESVPVPAKKSKTSRKTRRKGALAPAKGTDIRKDSLPDTPDDDDDGITGSLDLDNEGAGFEEEDEAVGTLPREPEDDVEGEDIEDDVPARAPPKVRQAVAPVNADGIEVIRLSGSARGAERYALPPLTLLTEPTYLEQSESDAALQKKAAQLEEALRDFSVTARVDEIERGPVITRFDLILERGTKISKVTGLADDLAMALGVRRVRIAPVKGKSALGVEIPNRDRQTVYLRELAVAEDLGKRKIAIPLFLGKDASGHPLIEDLATTPHLLIAGRTGAGKSVFVNNLILSILLTRYPEECRLIMIDPKKVELEVYQDIPHLLTKVESNSKKATKILEWAVNQMEERYEILAATGVRHITSYNKLGKKVKREKLLRIYSEDEVDKLPDHLPYVVIIVDELADLMMVAGKEVEQSIARLAQKARAVGIHVVLATQRPSTDVITGLIKSNLPARIAFQTRTGIDSRTILDRYGAEKLLDKGDMLYLSSTSDDPRRVQGPFVSDEEVEHVVSYLKEHAAPLYTHKLEQVSDAGGDAQSIMGQDELFEEAVDIVFSTGQASASFLQRRMKVGYARASRLIDLMGDAGIVSEHRGSKAREILLSPEEWEGMRAAQRTADVS